MALAIISCTPGSRSEWLNAAQRCSYATFFHTPLWAELLMGAHPGRYVPVPKRVLFSDNTSAILTFSLHRRGFGMLSSLQLSAAGTYGGWVSSDTLTSEHARLLTKKVESYRNSLWVENPFDPIMTQVGFLKSTMDYTQAVHLVGPEMPTEQRGSRAHRKAVKKALRNDIIIKRAETWNDFTRYYKLYEDSLARWRSRRLSVGEVYSLRLFRLVFETCKDVATLWYAERDGGMLSGILCFYWNNHAVAWHGAASSSSLPLRPNNLLYEEAIGDAANKGYEWFDLNPCGGLRGVSTFKEHLGATRIPLRKSSNRSGLRALVGLAQHFKTGRLGSA